MSDRNATAHSAFSGPRASYVALASMTTLGLVFLTSLWIPDVSGFVGILGLLAVYLPSTEFLTLYVIFAPTSLLIDIMRLAVTVDKSTRHSGWLIFFSLLAMMAKAAGSLFAWSLQRSLSGDGAYGAINGSPDPSAGYARMESPYTTFNAPPPAFASPPAFSNPPAVHNPAPAPVPAFQAANAHLYVPPTSTPA